jgi:hypothetical protein
MQTYVLIKTGLVLHLIGISLMVGITMVSVFAYQQSWSLLNTEKERSFVILKGTASYPMLQLIGALIIVTGGIVMMLGYHGIIMRMLWFKMKLVLLALIVVSQLFLGRPAGKNLKKILLTSQNNNTVKQSEIIDVNRKLRFFNSVQLALFLLIFILSSFRFG